jgi:hypothetical protein
VFPSAQVLAQDHDTLSQMAAMAESGMRPWQQPQDQAATAADSEPTSSKAACVAPNTKQQHCRPRAVRSASTRASGGMWPRLTDIELDAPTVRDLDAYQHLLLARVCVCVCVFVCVRQVLRVSTYRNLHV